VVAATAENFSSDDAILAEPLLDAAIAMAVQQHGRAIRFFAREDFQHGQSSELLPDLNRPFLADNAATAAGVT
jgi:hypothetical protein